MDSLRRDVRPQVKTRGLFRFWRRTGEAAKRGDDHRTSPETSLIAAALGADGAGREAGATSASCRRADFICALPCCDLKRPTGAATKSSAGVHSPVVGAEIQGAAEPLLTDLEKRPLAEYPERATNPHRLPRQAYVGQPVGGRWADMTMHVEDAVVLVIVMLNVSAFAAFIVAALLVQ